MNNQIVSTTRLLNSLRVSCKRERREIENLYNEKTRLEAIIAQFKNNNEEYLNKIKHADYEGIKSVLTDSKLLLKVAIASVIEALRIKPELYNFIIYDNSNNNTTISYASNYLSSMLSGQQHQQRSFNDSYTALILKILKESEKLYNELTKELTEL